MRKSGTRSTDKPAGYVAREQGVKVYKNADVSVVGTLSLLLLLLPLLQVAIGCAPTVALEAPKEPIVINMNIKVEHEIKMSVDDDLEDLFDDDKEIF